MDPTLPKSPKLTGAVDFAFPYDVAADGTTAKTADVAGEAAAEDRHLRDLIEQLLFTAPGERVNRPELGSGLYDLVFEPASDALVASLQMGVQATIQHHLADRLELEGVEVTHTEGSLRITVAYRARHDGRLRMETFEKER